MDNNGQRDIVDKEEIMNPYYSEYTLKQKHKGGLEIPHHDQQGAVKTSTMLCQGSLQTRGP